MRGLIYKDFINMKSYSRVILIMTLVFLASSIISEMGTAMANALLVLYVFFPIATFSYDLYSKWDSFATTFPIGRDKMVLSRYIVSLVFVGIGAVLYFVVFLIDSVQNNVRITAQQGTQFAALLSTALIFVSFMLPVTYKWGVEKGRVIILAPFLLLVAAVALLARFRLLPDENTLQMIYKALPAIAVVFLFLSFLCSISIFRKKEF